MKKKLLVLLLLPLSLVATTVSAEERKCTATIIEEGAKYPKTISDVHFDGQSYEHEGFTFTGDSKWKKRGYYAVAYKPSSSSLKGFDMYGYCLTPHASEQNEFYCTEQTGSFAEKVKKIVAYNKEASGSYDAELQKVKSISVRLAAKLSNTSNCQDWNTDCKAVYQGLNDYYSFKKGMMAKEVYDRSANVVIKPDQREFDVTTLDAAIALYDAAMNSNAKFDGKIYLCHPKSDPDNTHQNFVIAVSGTGKIITDCKDPDTPNDEDIKPRGELNNCCEDSTHSVVSNGALDDLFVCDCLNDVDYLRFKANTQKYLVESANGKYSDGALDKDYCSLYCTDTVTIDMPTSTQAGVFSYFTFKELDINGDKTTAPITSDYEACRVRMRFDRWISDYVTKVEKEISSYNDYQKDLKTYLLYENHSTQSTGKVVYKLTCKSEGYDASCTNNKNVPSDPLSSYTDGVVATETVNSNVIHYDHGYNDKNITYYKVAKDFDETKVLDAIKKYDSIKITSGGSATLTDTEYDFWPSSGSYTTANNTISAKKKEMEDKGGDTYTCKTKNDTTTSITCSISVTYYYGNNEVKNGISANETHKTLNEMKTEARNAYQNDATAFAEASNTAKKLEDTLYVCQNYFAQFGGANYNERITFNPELDNMTYTTKYITDDGFADIPYSYKYDRQERITDAAVYVANKGIYKHPLPAVVENKSIVSNVMGDAIYDLVDARYSTAYGDSNKVFKDLRCTSDMFKSEDTIEQSTVGSGTTAGTYETNLCTGESVMKWLALPDENASQYKDRLDADYKTKATFMTDGAYHSTYYWKSKATKYYTVGNTGYTTDDVKSTTTGGFKTVLSIKNGNLTKHLTKFFTQQNTAKGKYEVTWNLSNLDSKGILDEYLAQDKNVVSCSNQQGYHGMTCPLVFEDAIYVEYGCFDDTDDLFTDADKEYLTAANKCTGEPKTKIHFNFKVADPSNLFPTCGNIDNSSAKAACFDKIKYGYNWLVEDDSKYYEVINGDKKVMDDIREKSSSTYAPENKTYSFTLSSSDLKAIRVYNEQQEKDAGGYEDFNLKCKKSCDANKELDYYKIGYRKPGTNELIVLDSIAYVDSCRQCYSNFLNDLANGEVKYSDNTTYKSETKDLFKGELAKIRSNNKWW